VGQEDPLHNEKRKVLLSPRQIEWTLGRIEKELKLMQRGKTRKSSIIFPEEELALRITLEMTHASDEETETSQDPA